MSLTLLPPEPKPSGLSPMLVLVALAGIVALALFLGGCEPFVGEADAQQITPVRQSKLPWTTVLNNVSGSQTSTKIFDTSAFASMLVSFYDGGGSPACLSASTSTWEVMPLAPFARIQVTANIDTLAVYVDGAQTATGIYSSIAGQRMNNPRLVPVSGAGAGTCRYSIDVSLVPFSSAVIVGGPFGDNQFMGNVPDNIMPVPVGGAFTASEAGAWATTLQGDRDTAGLWTGHKAFPTDTASSPLSVSSSSATTVFTFTYVRGCLTASNVGTVDLWCNVAGTANASSTVYQFPLNSSGSADKRGDTFTTPQRYTNGQIFSCLAASGTGKIAFAGHPCP